MEDHEFNHSFEIQSNVQDLLTGKWGGAPSYGSAYLKSFPDYVADQASKNQFVELLVERLKENRVSLDRNALSLVLGTGHGPHEFSLSDQGFKLVGLDICYESLLIAHQQADMYHINSSHVVADMIVPFPFKKNLFEAVFNLGTSFGFDKDDERNASVFVNVVEVLKPKGVFVFDYVNPIWIKETKFTKETRLQDGSTRFEEFIYDTDTRSSFTKFEFTGVNGEKSYFYHFIKYYSVNQVCSMMERAGLKVLKVYGHVDGRPFSDIESYQMVIIAQKEGGIS